MNPKTEEFLYLLLWACETLSRPTWRNLTESYEGWAYRNGLLRQLQRLEKQQWLERHPKDRLHRLTEAGRLRAQGGRDPAACWNRPWDEVWRLVIFDVPEPRRNERRQIRDCLRSYGFGYLQKSVWITPDPVNEVRALLAHGPADVESLILLEARPGAGEKNAEIVAGAWDFEKLKGQYENYRGVLARRPRCPLDTEAAAGAFQRWLGEERTAWLNIMWYDPLLPECLLPPGYTGREAWRERVEAMGEAGQQIRGFPRQF